MRDRLIELLKRIDYVFDDNQKLVGNPSEYVVGYLLANGVIVPPVNTGETVYWSSIAYKKVQPFVVVEAHIHLVGKEASFEYKAENGEYPMHFSGSTIGKTVFLTREEAEQALKGGEG